MRSSPPRFSGLLPFFLALSLLTSQPLGASEPPDRFEYLRIALPLKVRQINSIGNEITALESLHSAGWSPSDREETRRKLLALRERLKAVRAALVSLLEEHGGSR